MKFPKIKNSLPYVLLLTFFALVSCQNSILQNCKPPEFRVLTKNLKIVKGNEASIDISVKRDNFRDCSNGYLIVNGIPLDKSYLQYLSVESKEIYGSEYSGKITVKSKSHSKIGSTNIKINFTSDFNLEIPIEILDSKKPGDYDSSYGNSNSEPNYGILSFVTSNGLSISSISNGSTLYLHYSFYENDKFLSKIFGINANGDLETKIGNNGFDVKNLASLQKGKAFVSNSKIYYISSTIPWELRTFDGDELTSKIIRDDLNGLYSNTNLIYQRSGKEVGLVGNYQNSPVFYQINVDESDLNFGQIAENATKPFPKIGLYVQGITLDSQKNIIGFLTEDTSYVETAKKVILFRLKPDLSLDTGFGINGYLEIPSIQTENRNTQIKSFSDGSLAFLYNRKIMKISNLGQIVNAYSYALEPDTDKMNTSFAIDRFDRLLIVERKNLAANSLYELYLTRLNTDGQPDKNFGQNGSVKLAYGYSSQAVFIQSDDKIVTVSGGGTSTVLQRFLP
jgi:hypothetical protein